MNDFEFIIFVKKVGPYTNWLNISYLCTSLQQYGFQTQVFFYDLSEVDLAIREVSMRKPMMVGLSLLRINHEVSMDFANQLRESQPEIRIVAGNIQANVYAEYILKNSCIDYILLGECENSLPKLCSIIQNGGNLENCSGLCYLDSGVFKKTKTGPPFDVNSIKLPDRSFFDRRTGNYFEVSSVRGCEGKCSFCASTIGGHKVWVRKIIDVIHEIDYLIKHMGCNYVIFIDPTFPCGSTNRLKELYYALKKHNLWVPFQIYIRVEQINQSLIDDCIELSSVGLDNIFLGMESANNEDLRVYRKRCNLANITKTIELLDKNGLLHVNDKLDFQYGWINFNPYSTIEKIKGNVTFLREHKLYIDTKVLSNRIHLTGGSSIVKKMADDGLLMQESHMPITDPFIYKFVDPRIHDLIKYVDEINSGIDNSLFFIQLASFLRIHNHYAQKNETIDLNDLLSQLHSYKTFVSNSLIDLFNQAIALAEDKGYIQGYMRSQILECIDKLKNESKALKLAQTKVMRSLFRKGKLPFAEVFK